MAAGRVPLDRNAPAQSDVGAVISVQDGSLDRRRDRCRLTLLREKEETVALEAEEKAARGRALRCVQKQEEMRGISQGRACRREIKQSMYEKRPG